MRGPQVSGRWVSWAVSARRADDGLVAGFLEATMPAADLVHNLARRLTDRRADAEDLVQETYLRDRPTLRLRPWAGSTGR